MGSSRHPPREPLGFVSGLPLTRAEKAACKDVRAKGAAARSEFERMCRSLGVPIAAPPKALRRLWARMQGEKDDAA